MVHPEHWELAIRAFEEPGESQGQPEVEQESLPGAAELEPVQPLQACKGPRASLGTAEAVRYSRRTSAHGPGSVLSPRYRERGASRRYALRAPRA